MGTKFWWIAITGAAHSPSASAYTVEQASKLTVRSVSGSIAWVSNARKWLKSDFDVLYGFNTQAEQQQACRVLEDETQQSRFEAAAMVVPEHRVGAFH